MFQYLIIFLIMFGVISLLKSYIRKRDASKVIETENDTLDERFNAKKRQKELEIDSILDKVAEKGIESLSTNERKILDKYSSEQ